MNSTDRLSRAASSAWGTRIPSDFASSLLGSRRSAHALRIGVWLMAAAPFAFALVAIGLGKEAGWDFQNYHWYVPFALLDGRLGFDLAPAHHATYYNPLLDVPTYVLATHAPAWTVGAYLGFLFGVAVVLIGAIAHQVVALKNPYLRLCVATALAVAGALGGGAFPAIGNNANDVPVAIGVFAAVLISIKQFSSAAPALKRESLYLLFIAGLCAGASAGLKLTTLLYAIGLSTAVLVCGSGWRARGAHWLALNLGIAAGFLLFAGYWMARLWAYSGNPFFPFFNDLFHSPLLVEGSYRDPSYLPQTSLSAWLFPFYFTADSHRVAEWDFRDAHIAAAYVIVPVTALLMLIKRFRTQGPVAPPAALFLFVFASVAYLIWLLMFGVYRYLIPLEMLSPLLIAAALMLWPLRRSWQAGAILVLLVALQASEKMEIKRLPWNDGAYVAAQTPILPEHSMVLMTGIAPMAFAIPAFSHDIPFIRIDGWMVWKDDSSSGLARVMRQRVQQHPGPLYMLFSPAEDQRAVEAASAYGLQFAAEDCDLVRSNIAEALKLCRLLRS